VPPCQEAGDPYREHGEVPHDLRDLPQTYGVEAEHIYARGNIQLFDLSRRAETRYPHRERREVSLDLCNLS